MLRRNLNTILINPEFQRESSLRRACAIVQVQAEILVCYSVHRLVKSTPAQRNPRSSHLSACFTTADVSPVDCRPKLIISVNCNLFVHTNWLCHGRSPLQIDKDVITTNYLANNWKVINRPITEEKLAVTCLPSPVGQAVLLAKRFSVFGWRIEHCRNSVSAWNVY